MITKTENMAKKAARDAARCEVRLHFTMDELDEMEKRAREWSRMDWCDKVKLISQARHAIEMERVARVLATRMIDAIDIMGDLKAIENKLSGNDGN